MLLRIRSGPPENTQDCPGFPLRAEKPLPLRRIFFFASFHYIRIIFIRGGRLPGPSSQARGMRAIDSARAKA